LFRPVMLGTVDWCALSRPVARGRMPRLGSPELRWKDSCQKQCSHRSSKVVFALPCKSSLGCGAKCKTFAILLLRSSSDSWCALEYCRLCGAVKDLRQYHTRVIWGQVLCSVVLCQSRLRGRMKDSCHIFNHGGLRKTTVRIRPQWMCLACKVRDRNFI